MRKFFVNSQNIGETQIIIDDKNDVNHIVKVLRLDIGTHINISDNSTYEYLCEITQITKKEIVAQILSKSELATETNISVTLFQGIPKQGKIDLIVQKTVELGVHSIVPVFMERTVISDKGNFSKKVARFNTIAGEAAKQSKRGIVPVVEEGRNFQDIIDYLKTFDFLLFPYEEENTVTIKSALRKLSDNGKIPENIAIIIGPEGGFAPNEAMALTALENCQCVTLGKTILRTETASIATLAMVMYELEL